MVALGCFVTIFIFCGIAWVWANRLGKQAEVRKAYSMGYGDNLLFYKVGGVMAWQRAYKIATEHTSRKSKKELEKMLKIVNEESQRRIDEARRLEYMYKYALDDPGHTRAQAAEIKAKETKELVKAEILDHVWYIITHYLEGGNVKTIKPPYELKYDVKFATTKTLAI